MANTSMILRNFFDIMGKEPETIISDRGKGIIEGIKSLLREDGYHGHHLFDSFHLMKGIRTQSPLKKYYHALYRSSDSE